MRGVDDTGEPVIAIEVTGSLHRAWAAELERRHPGALRLFAPSETKAARMQLGSGRFKTADRDCAALMGIAWGLSRYPPSFAERNAELRAGGMAPIQARVALARNACRLIYRLLVTHQPFDEAAYRRGRLSRGW
jgi:hypothetical protein